MCLCISRDFSSSFSVRSILAFTSKIVSTPDATAFASSPSMAYSLRMSSMRSLKYAMSFSYSICCFRTSVFCVSSSTVLLVLISLLMSPSIYAMTMRSRLLSRSFRRGRMASSFSCMAAILVSNSPMSSIAEPQRYMLSSSTARYHSNESRALMLMTVLLLHSLPDDAR